MEFKLEVPLPEAEVSVPRANRTMSEAEFTKGLGADWMTMLKTIRDTSTFRELKTDRELEAATKAMLARHRMRIYAAQLRVEREAKALAEDSST